jgi:hypothetical protein
MSWEVDGVYYHTREEYELALARQKRERLNRRIADLAAPSPAAALLESALADAHTRLRAVERLAAELEAQTQENARVMSAQRAEVEQGFAELAQAERKLVQRLDGLRQDFGAQIDRLDERRRQDAAAVTASWEQEIAADRQSAERAERRRELLTQGAAETLAPWDEQSLAPLGLDRTGVDGLLGRARQAEVVEGLELARRACDQAYALAADARLRQETLRSLRQQHLQEVESLLALLDFSAEERRTLVGEGDAALDAPLRHELDRISRQISAVTFYDDHEDAFESIGKALDVVALRATDLAAQVRDFERLEDTRVDLVRNRLADKLSEALEQRVTIETVTAGALGLQPVEVHLRTSGGEQIDCSVGVDGTLRIHHYGHLDQATCARSAVKMTDKLPELMAMRTKPTLDVAASASPAASATRSDRDWEELGRQNAWRERE